MKTFRYTETDGTIRILNPMFITDVKFVQSEYSKDSKEWCIVLSLNGHRLNDHTFILPYKTKEEAEAFLNEINECLESI